MQAALFDGEDDPRAILRCQSASRSAVSGSIADVLIRAVTENGAFGVVRQKRCGKCLGICSEQSFLSTTRSVMVMCRHLVVKFLIGAHDQ